jgi:hypothetical protein
LLYRPRPARPTRSAGALAAGRRPGARLDGFAIGRSIWQDPLHAHLHHLGTAGEARSHITAAYLDYARYYLAARDGALTGAADPEFW